MLQIQAIGYLGKDAIISNKNGKSVINFSIAHTEKFKNQMVQKLNKQLGLTVPFGNVKT
jgi:hypothetical protein